MEVKLSFDGAEEKCECSIQKLRVGVERVMTFTGNLGCFGCIEE